ncbi:hypothetical protein GCM10022246_26080 [Pedobacter ginsengiterrae]|uniref:Uncharacterized protein n=1 Tax=Pedobacter ginsengiterrae TaxID=871696 RepID=A0ABP7PWM1_9SPHI
MAKIIALRGDSNRGKSKTLNIVYQYLLLFGYVQVPKYFGVLGNRDQYDFIDIVEKKGVKVGIATMGDYQNGLQRKRKGSVESMIDHLVGAGCDVVVCAVNLGLTRAISHISSYPHEFVNKSVSLSDDEERIKNGEDAEKIYKLI